jgi:proteasome lid subunit RPN8/RPN11
VVKVCKLTGCKGLLVKIIAGGVLIWTIYLLIFCRVNFEEEKPFRNDLTVIFSQEMLDTFNLEYKNFDKEYLFCLLGEKNGKIIRVKEIVQPEIHLQGPDIVTPSEDPACQREDAIGSIHSHPDGSCNPSNDDFFAWGEMKNPEPLINAIQCGYNQFYILEMPGQHQPLNLHGLPWHVE